MNIQEQAVKQLIQSAQNQFFTVTFTKRSTGELRTMNCRLGVTKHLKGGTKNYDDSEHALLTVFDMVKKGYRSIPLENVHTVKIDGIEYTIHRKPKQGTLAV